MITQCRSQSSDPGIASGGRGGGLECRYNMGRIKKLTTSCGTAYPAPQLATVLESLLFTKYVGALYHCFTELPL